MPLGRISYLRRRGLPLHSSYLRDKIARLDRALDSYIGMSEIQNLEPAAVEEGAGAGFAAIKRKRKLTKKRTHWNAAETNLLATLLPAYWTAFMADRGPALRHLTDAMNGSARAMRRQFTMEMIRLKLKTEMEGVRKGWVRRRINLPFTFFLKKKSCPHVMPAH